MEQHTDTQGHEPSSAPGQPAGHAPHRARPLRLPSQRLSALLAALLLGVGIAIGAAIGPAPEVSLAGNSTEITQRLLAAILAERASTPATSASSSPATSSSAPEPSETRAAAPASTKAAEPASSSGEETGGGEKNGKQAAEKAKSPPVSSVWLIELSGTSLSAAVAQPAAAPFISQTVRQGALLNRWSSLSAGTFASAAALAEPPAEGGVPPLLRTIVQPPCPEGEAGQACAPETPGQLTTADNFLKATLATITSTPAYMEHGLVVITFATVGLATQSGLPEGASSVTLTYQPPAGALLLSPFVKAGSKPSQAFTPSSPRKSLEKLLHS